jgi:4-aminobutyrate aminotransferase-like enzyme
VLHARPAIRCGGHALSTARAEADAPARDPRARALDSLAEGMARPMTEMEIASGSGSYLTSADDERYLDFTSGIGVTNTGHCHPRVVAAAQEQLAKLLHGQVSVGLSAPLVALTNRMIDGVVPDSHDRVMFSTTGAEAVENAVRLVRATTGRPNLIVFQGGYHGRTIGTLALTRSKTSYGAANHPQMPGVFVAPFPYASQAPGVDSDAALNQVRWLPPLPPRQPLREHGSRCLPPPPSCGAARAAAQAADRALRHGGRDH